MPRPAAGRTFTFRAGVLVLIAASFLLSSRPAPAYQPTFTSAASIIHWGPASPATIWNDSTKTVTWSFYPGFFPRPTWPTVSQAGAAFQNAFQSHVDVAGALHQAIRGPDTSAPPGLVDGRLTTAYVLNQKSDYYGSDLTGIVGATYAYYDVATGCLVDADTFLNGDPTAQGFSTDGVVSFTVYDAQTVCTHEQMHLWGSAHSPYLGSVVFPFARYPPTPLQDRCLSPDDRAYHRFLYPASAGQGGTLTGVATLSVGGGAPDRAIVVATDANGVPQAITPTSATGAYSLNVPAGANYSLTLFHGVNTAYIPTYSLDVDYSTATPFVGSTTVGGITATDGAVTAVPTALVATNPAGLHPTLKLRWQSILSAPTNHEAVFMPTGSTGTLRLEIDNGGTPLTAGQVSGVTLGSGQAGDITITGPFAVSTSPSGFTAYVDIPYGVPATAIPGFRNLSVTTNINGNERLFVPGVAKVIGPGGLAVSASGVGNPPSGPISFGLADAPLLRVHFQASTATASNNEDVRIRNLLFTIAGTGPTLPAVRLWVDRGTAGVVDAADTRIFNGTAYANSPVSETLSVTPTSTVAFNDLSLTVPAGQGIDLLLTADIPASGAGDYKATLDPTSPANLTAHGMFWGDAITPSGGAVSGGTLTLGSLAIGGLAQKQTTAGTLIPVGGTTPETQATFIGIPTTSTGTCGMEIEVKPLAVAFDGTGTHSSATTFASGATVTQNVTGLTDLTAYHWRARAISATLSPSPWVSFGGNAESAQDFACDSSTTGPPSALAQFSEDGVTPLAVGDTSHVSVTLEGTTGTSSGGLPVAVEFEVQPATTAFTNVPNLGTAFVGVGVPAAARFQGATGDYHWQARTIDSLGVASSWVLFDPATIHFHLEAQVVQTAQVGCAGTVATVPPGGGVLLAFACAAALLFMVPRRSLRRAGPGLVLFLLLSSRVWADEPDALLPSSLFAENLPTASVREWESNPAFSPEPSPPGFGKSPFSADIYLGALFLDSKFSAIGTDFVERTAKGMGAAVLGLEGFYRIAPDWRVGLLAEVDLWSDLQILAGGVEGAWRFSFSQGAAMRNQPEMEHFLKLAILYEDLQITKSNFGSFAGTIGIRAGYEFRYAFTPEWALLIDAGLQYAQWKYHPPVLSGDTTFGGIGGLLTLGISYQF